jgi:hypothetical protein
LKRYLYLQFLQAVSSAQHRYTDWYKAFREFSESGAWMTPGRWIRRSYMDYIRVRTLYLLPKDTIIAPIYSGTFEDSDQCPRNPREEPYMHHKMDQDFNARAESEDTDSDDSDGVPSVEIIMEEPEDDSNPVVALGLDEQSELRGRVEQIKRASPRSAHRVGTHRDLPVRKTRKIPSGEPTTPPAPEKRGKRKRSFGRRISDQTRRLIGRGERSSSPIEEEISPTAAVKERRDKRHVSLTERMTRARDGIKKMVKRGGGGNGPPAA